MTVKRTMSRWTIGGALALAAVGAVGGVAPGVATAEAAPRTVSQFAGSYAGRVPNVNAEVLWEITVSRSGAVKGSYRNTIRYRDRRDPWSEFTSTATGAFTGIVDTDGNLEISGEQTYEYNHGAVQRSTFTASVLVVTDANGDLVVTNGATGTSEVWTLQ